MKFQVYKQKRGIKVSLGGGTVEAATQAPMSGGDWRWKLTNGSDTLADSGVPYTSKDECLKAIQTLVDGLKGDTAPEVEQLD